ncbi:WGR domain-containing protein [Nostoc sp. TCL240-02]|uniref:WGR domain-containing protein n=1 Tax=Nostoc sp. TCL240-02 TaxID=2572090 RepID=UPI0034A026DA
METYLVFVDAVNNSNKFWSAKVEDNSLIVEWGRVGYNSQKKVHSLLSHQQAVFKFHNLVAEKNLRATEKVSHKWMANAVFQISDERYNY